VSEKDMEERFLEELASMQNEEIAEKMSAAIKRLALPKATSDIADLIDGLGE
jgi:UDP-N-acetylglucosamine:LPS N-acetylglucosamine transferase